MLYIKICHNHNLRSILQNYKLNLLIKTFDRLRRCGLKHARSVAYKGYKDHLLMAKVLGKTHETHASELRP